MDLKARRIRVRRLVTYVPGHGLVVPLLVKNGAVRQQRFHAQRVIPITSQTMLQGAQSYCP